MQTNIDINVDHDEQYRYRHPKKKHPLLKALFIIFNVIFVIYITVTLSYKGINNVIDNNKQVKFKQKKKIFTVKDERLPPGFYFLNNNHTNGPITVDRQADDGTKTDFYKVLPEYFNDINRNNNNNNTSIKDDNLPFNKANIAIVMFANYVKVNTIYENAISEFYQYANFYNYRLLFNEINYNKDKEIFYMKISVIIEALIEGMKTKLYDWIFWVDSDVILTNPTIRLEAYLPEDENVHFVAAADKNGLNAGVFLLRVNSWSYNLMTKVLAYPDYHKDDFIRFAEQTAINNLLSSEEETEHYVIVPRSWFNQYSGAKAKGNFLIHFPGTNNKSEKVKMIREEINRDWYLANNNKRAREEALKYFSRPREKQEYGGYFTYREYEKTLVDRLIDIKNKLNL